MTQDEPTRQEQAHELRGRVMQMITPPASDSSVCDVAYEHAAEEFLAGLDELDAGHGAAASAHFSAGLAWAAAGDDCYAAQAALSKTL